MEKKTYPNPPIADGFYPRIDELAYRSDPAVAISDLKEMHLSPMHFWSKKFGDYRPDRSKAQELGTLVHLAALEPHSFDANVVCIPHDAPRRPTEAQRNAKNPSPSTIEAVEWWNQWELSTEGKMVVNSETLAEVRKIHESIMSHPDASGLLAGSNTEVGMFFTLDVNGQKVRVKGKLDIDVQMTPIIADIKTVDRGYANAWDFGKSITKWRYHEQAAHYIDVYNGLMGTLHKDSFEAPPNKERWVFIVVEKEPPYAVATMELYAEDIESGRAANRHNINLLSECLRTDVWPCTPTERQSVGMAQFKR
jgi:hypothetical protein